MVRKVLIIDDDIGHLTVLRHYLEGKGYQVQLACEGRQGLRTAYNFQPDVIVLDLVMPGMDGFEICTRLRELTDAPILILTARKEEDDELRGLSLGADDYLRKPIKMALLEAHLNALLKRSKRHRDVLQGECYADGHLTIDIDARLATWEGQPIHFSFTEFRLLGALLRNAGQVVSRRRLMTDVWGEAYEDDYELLALYIYYVRKKLRQAGCDLPYIQTAWGEGYIFMPLSSQNCSPQATQDN
jgi:two-component system response regulator VicR